MKAFEVKKYASKGVVVFFSVRFIYQMIERLLSTLHYLSNQPGTQENV